MTTTNTTNQPTNTTQEGTNHMTDITFQKVTAGTYTAETDRGTYRVERIGALWHITYPRGTAPGTEDSAARTMRDAVAACTTHYAATAETSDVVTTNASSSQVARVVRDRYGRETLHTPHVPTGYASGRNVRPSFVKNANAVPAYEATIRGVYGDPRTTWKTNAELTNRDRVTLRHDVPRCAVIVREHFKTRDHACGLLTAPGSDVCVFHVASTYERRAVRLPVALIDLGTLERLRAHVTRHDGPRPIYVAPAGDLDAKYRYANAATTYHGNLLSGADGYGDAFTIRTSHGGGTLWDWQDAGTAFAAEAIERVERVAWCAVCGEVRGEKGNRVRYGAVTVGIDEPCQHITAGRTAGAAIPARLDGPRADAPNTYRYATQGTGAVVRVDASPAVITREETFRASLAKKSHAWDVDARGRYIYRGVRTSPRRRPSSPVRVGWLTYAGRWTMRTRDRVKRDGYGRYGFRAYRAPIAPNVTATCVASWDPRPAWNETRDYVWTSKRTARGKTRRPRVTAQSVAKSRATRAANRAARLSQVMGAI